MDLNLEAPDHTTLSRRSRGLKVKLAATESKKPIHLIIDSTELSIVGEGEWAAAKHGGRGKRGWRKLHIGVDRAGMQSMLGDKLDARGLAAQKVEAAIGCKVLNRLLVLGRPRSVAIAR